MDNNDVHFAFRTDDFEGILKTAEGSQRNATKTTSPGMHSYAFAVTTISGVL